MKRLRGKNAGQQLTPIQYSNDWIMADDGQGNAVIVSPRAVQLDPEDLPMFTLDDPACHQHTGTFWEEWRLDAEQGRFYPRAMLLRPSEQT